MFLIVKSELQAMAIKAIAVQVQALFESRE
jgi:hypothetical protein